jgi:hypothetical protein
MPLKQTIYGGECVLGKFRIDVPGGAGGYTNDPVEACFTCNFSDIKDTDINNKGFDLDRICQCPIDMTWERYNSLRKQYSLNRIELTKKGFLEFVIMKEKENKEKGEKRI